MSSGEKVKGPTYLSPRTEKRASGVHGRGLFAREPIGRGEIVAVKGGSILTTEKWAALELTVGPAAEVHVSTDLVIAPRVAAEYEGSMMHLNHACDPNVGVEGQIVFVAIRDVAAGEELVLDYAMMDDHDETMECHCGSEGCRGRVTGKDWQRADLQRRYRGYFSSYLEHKIARAPEVGRPALVPEFYVSDLEASLEFYIGVLGFELDYERKAERFAALSRGGAHLMLEEAPSLGRATASAFDRGEWRLADLERPFGRGVNLEIRIDDIGALNDRIVAMNHPLLVEVHERTYRLKVGARRVRQLLVADPDGYLIRPTQFLSES
jgi:catechol 2,3-dioxygenase-like lactoylglutathione lyase family enzyme